MKKSINAHDINERKQSEEKINLLAHSLKSIKESVVITDLQDNILFVNDAFLKTYGYSEKELIGKNISIVHSPKISKDVYEEIIPSIFRNGGWNAEIWNIRKDGSEFPISLSTSSVRDSDGKYIALIGVAEDISERRQTLETLSKSEAFLSNALKIAHMAHWEYDVGSDLFTLNDNFYKIFKTTAEKEGGYYLSSKDYTNRFVYPDDTFLVTNEIQKAIETKKADFNSQLEHRIIYADGEIGFLNVIFFAVKDKNGNTIKTYGLIKDITEKKHVELALRRVITDARCLLWHAHVVYKKGKYQWKLQISNEDSALEFLPVKVTAGQTYSEAWLESKLEEEIAQLAQNFQTAMELNKPGYNQEFRCRLSDGSIRWLYEDVRISPGLPGEWELVGVCTDITGKKQTEDKLIEAKQKAEEMNLLKTNFLANMSHELRTPLMGVLGFADILKTELTNPSHREMAKTISHSGIRLLDTLNLILDLSKIESDCLYVSYSLFELVDYIRKICESYREAIEKKGLYLKIISKISSIKINLDQRLLGVIIENLLNNAIKYTKAGGITVSVDKETRAGEEWALIKVADTGIGIPEESREIIFEEFRQVSEGFSRNFQGTGLGLTITKKFIEKMNGTVSVESEMDKGSTFIVTLPVSPATKTGKKSGSVISGKNKQIELISEYEEEAKHIKILIVEDDVISRTVTEIFLKKKYNVKAVSTAIEAIEIAGNTQFDVVLMDINLGKGMSGLDAIRELRKIPGYKLVPVIASTAFAMSGDKEEFLEAGCTHYLSKPFGKEDLYSVVNEAIETLAFHS